MNYENLMARAASIFNAAPENTVTAEDALRPDLAGMKIYDEPICGVAAAGDPLFGQLKRPEIVGPESMTPQEWNAGARSVLSFFFPFTERVRQSNRPAGNRRPGAPASDEWLHGRIEGQMMLNAFGKALCEILRAEGFSAVCPSIDSRFRKTSPYASNWSERHAAYVCGLGTFGLSRGLITRKGMAGRFISVITSAEIPPTPREYADPFEYCIMCGKCQVNCPAGAIDISKGVVNGKDQLVCGPFLDKSRLPPHGPHQRVRYGCGNCQVDVPCESGIPLSARRRKKDS